MDRMESSPASVCHPSGMSELTSLYRPLLSIRILATRLEGNPQIEADFAG